MYYTYNIERNLEDTKMSIKTKVEIETKLWPAWKSAKELETLVGTIAYLATTASSFYIVVTLL